MKASLIMLSNFLKNPKQTGAVAQSSKFLTKEMINKAELNKSKFIVELGPGIGTFTGQILKKAKPDAKAVCFEVNKKFCSYLDKNFDDKRLIVINGGADKIRINLKKLGIKKADCIISGLPFRNFSHEMKERIIQEVKNSLSDNGRFILFQYTTSMNDMLKKHFDKVNRKFVLLNMPPAFVYTCTNH